MKKFKVVCEPWVGKKKIFWEDESSLNIYELVKWCKRLGFKRITINFGPEEKQTWNI